jgi:dihydrofolate reductase
VSLDGFIARADGSIDWLDAYNPAPDGGDYGYSDFVATVDTTLMGMKTFEFVRNVPGGAEYHKGFRNFVFTRNASGQSFPHMTFVSDDIAAFVGSLKNEKGKNIWLIGGGQINGALLKAGLIDEMILSYIPIVLGGGIPLFAHGSGEASFKLRNSTSWSNGVVQVTLASVPPGSTGLRQP